MQEKIDLFKQLKGEDYLAPRKPALVTVEKAQYLAIEGQGAPGSDEFKIKIGALYGVAYTIKMTRKFAGEQDYVVGKLEAQWWSDSEASDFSSVPSDQWCWKLMIRTPDFVSMDELKKAVSVLLEKGKEPEVNQVGFETLTEGQCVQVLHVGPYEEEGETIAQMKAFAGDQGLMFSGYHHEIYLSDPRRVPPEKLKTILRRPAAKTGHS